MRTAKKGPNAGSRFLGCSRYPDCKYTISRNS
ncbi:MAG TPA: topoisomerase DNA-binding C4 zinc finger domain-containing protein [Candidatus Ornithospirochaeta avicola]|uniref:Topoisomerase DNA-binding C4 zinc finger domain-containing protein n=1 Tax=Candidatus Ornithospirochaeta avicola TaxID=2840896 RepID=A0A9D1PSS5_9SPIO|nr:topoisomerase DNA-binding C4 zinc finger domain-containing protein [Candidatus Ornithospirochaeta avicola]